MKAFAFENLPTLLKIMILIPLLAAVLRENIKRCY
ncbi:hypothetical protein LI7559_05145 [Bacillus licheniformis LMG 7559]|nr:hypothetical protein LI7559_05145 [Bacillus licheniformis LMG 7559]